MAEIRLEHDIWLLVADGEKALFLRNEGDAEYPNLEVVHEIHDDNPPTREQGTDAPGRYADPQGAHKSSFEETDWHRLEKDRFAGQLSDWLYRLAHRGRFKKIVLIAPPQVLGALRRELHKEVSVRVAAEIPKTLTNHTVVSIEQVLTNG
ncbi:host attachment family protein [Phyllobacterium leguminum]|uniref:Protein required for attachment to host cells n=1 Tax=Phyllobacterium leguminum TaxID=314237 RepID=A0A318T766_9HYPH|nr:host attachment family protein [Phyllobacterium leguminum]PYE90380.1 protein required for attachment to host cells [Phyllobacterium leguminum]